MPNITLAIEEKTLKAARALAKSRGTTLNGLVREQLSSLIEQEARQEEARRGLIALMEKSTARLGKNYKFNREELYASPALSGHKRAGIRRSRKAG